MARRTSKRGVIEASSGNVFADLGLRDAKELDTKLRLTVEINRLLKTRRLESPFDHSPTSSCRLRHH